jgi:hypothetical protein
MKVEQHREEVIRLLTSLDERQKTIFKHIERIDNHLDKINGKVAINEKELTIIKTWGGVAMFAIPVIINLVMRTM